MQSTKNLNFIALTTTESKKLRKTGKCRFEYGGFIYLMEKGKDGKITAVDVLIPELKEQLLKDANSKLILERQPIKQNLGRQNRGYLSRA